jgi:hypothetical protein
MEIVTFLRDWIIPVLSVFLSIWFAASARKDAEKAQQVLKQINESVQGWQSDLMKAATDLLNTMPQVVNGKVRIAEAQMRASTSDLLIKALQNQDGSPFEKAEKTKEIGKVAREIFRQGNPESTDGL